jgi:hypothetical protein
VANPHQQHKLILLRRALAGVLLVAAGVGSIWLSGFVSTLLIQVLPRSPSRDWWVGVLFVSLGLLGWLILWKVPQWQVARVKGLSRKEQFDKRNEARRTLATILGGIAFLTGGYFTYRNFSLAQQSQITDRFAKATEQLGAMDSGGKPKLEVRLGAIYSLEAIANESRSFHWPTMEVLCAYVRVNAPVTEQESSKNTPSVAGKQRSTDKPASAQEQHPPADIQAVLTVLGRRKNSDWESANQTLDLSNTNLRQAHLSAANLSEANLTGADLTGADLGQADLGGANLVRAKLAGTFLFFVYVRAADLTGADLSGALYIFQDQINSARGSADTKLPAFLCLPRAWTNVTATTPRACPAQQ